MGAVAAAARAGSSDCRRLPRAPRWALRTGCGNAAANAFAATKAGVNPWVVVTVAPVQALKTPVTLEMVKAAVPLAEMELMKFQRLSVQKVTKAEWAIVLAMGGLDVRD